MAKITHQDYGTALAREEWESGSAHLVGGTPNIDVMPEPSAPGTGAVVYYSGSSWVTLPPGGSGQAILSSGTANVPYYGAAGAELGTPSLTLGTVSAVGTATRAIGIDASIAAFNTGTPGSQAFADVGTSGTIAYAARIDHKHPMPGSALLLTGGTMTGDIGINDNMIGPTEIHSLGTMTATPGTIAFGSNGYWQKAIVGASWTSAPTLTLPSKIQVCHLILVKSNDATERTVQWSGVTWLNNDTLATLTTTAKARFLVNLVPLGSSDWLGSYSTAGTEP